MRTFSGPIFLLGPIRVWRNLDSLKGAHAFSPGLCYDSVQRLQSFQAPPVAPFAGNIFWKLSRMLMLMFLFRNYTKALCRLHLIVSFILSPYLLDSSLSSTDDGHESEAHMFPDLRPSRLKPCSNVNLSCLSL